MKEAEWKAKEMEGGDLSWCRSQRIIQKLSEDIKQVGSEYKKMGMWEQYLG